MVQFYLLNVGFITAVISHSDYNSRWSWLAIVASDSCSLRDYFRYPSNRKKIIIFFVTPYYRFVQAANDSFQESSVYDNLSFDGQTSHVQSVDEWRDKALLFRVLFATGHCLMMMKKFRYHFRPAASTFGRRISQFWRARGYNFCVTRKKYVISAFFCHGPE